MRSALHAFVITALTIGASTSDAVAQVIATDFGRRLPTSESGVMIDHALAYDQRRERTIAWDAERNPGVIHEWDGAAWAGRALGAPIPATSGLRAGYDPVSASVLFFGGTSGAGVPTDRQWRWDGTTLLADGPQAPAAREGHGLCGTATGALLFGGDSGTGLLGDSWVWDGAAWTRVPGSGPSPRRDHAMAYSYFENAVYVFGGRDQGGLRNDFWRLELATSSWVLVGAAAPPAPREHAELVEGFGGFLLLFGGVDSRRRVLDEVHDFYVGLNAWQARGAVVDCHARHAIARHWARDEIIVHGGDASSGEGETWTADPEAIWNFPVFARATEYGRGRSEFRISTDTNPVLGATFVVDDRNQPSGTLATVMAFGSAGNRNDPSGFHLNPAAVWVVQPYGASVSVNVPTNTALSGTDVIIQAAAVTHGGTAYALSNSMRAVLGTW